MDNLALQDLDGLIGRWQVELTNASFLDAGATMRGTTTIEWLDGGAFVVLRSSMADDGPPDSVSVIGRNESRDDYEVLYADSRGVSRVYRMTFADGGWTQQREDPGFHQRFEAAVDPGGDRITGTWTRSHDDGVTWVHDFDLTYTRA